jgi:Mannitol dehydrogenase Rossmann domain
VNSSSEVPRLSRSLPATPAAAPVRIVHLGVGNFHRAHQAWYTAHSPDADQWGIAAFTGRRTDMADALKPQDGLYTLITRSGEGDSFELIGALSAVHGAVEHEAYLDYLSRAEMALVTITVTEAAYLRGADGHLDAGLDVVMPDEALRSDPRSFVASLPARLVSIFSSTVGTWGGVAFLAGAGVALFKTIIGNVPSLGRQVGNTLAVFGAFDWNDQKQRDRWMRVIMIVLPIVWGLLGTIVSSPLALVILAGILNAVFLMGVAVATLYLTHAQTDPRTKDGTGFLVMLVISAIAVFLVGIVGLINTF